MDRKRRILEEEGVTFDSDGKVSSACVLTVLPKLEEAAAGKRKAPALKSASKRRRLATVPADGVVCNDAADLAATLRQLLQERGTGKTC